MEKKILSENNEVVTEVIPTELPEGKCCTLYCGDCSYFNPAKTSYGKCWCGYYKQYSRNSSDIACSHFCR